MENSEKHVYPETKDQFFASKNPHKTNFIEIVRAVFEISKLYYVNTTIARLII